jgi:hypothetical protein
MDLKQRIACALVVTVAFYVMPSRLWAADEAAAARPPVATLPDAPAPTPDAVPVADLRASARDAVARLYAPPATGRPGPAYRATVAPHEDMGMQGGGGGSKFGMVMMLVEIGVSVGASYYLYQTLKKQQASSTTGGQ